MPVSPDTPEPRTLALAWLWSRPSSPTADDPVDLATLDQWRQGRLSSRRFAQVKRQIANDPRLMRLLEELVAADDLLRPLAAEARAPQQPFSTWVALRQLAGSTLSHWREPIWMGGLIAVAASLFVAALLLPVATTPDFGQQLKGIYAELDVPEKELTLPWGPKIAMRGGSQPERDPEAEASWQMARQAFQAGMVEGIKHLKARFPGVTFDFADQLHRSPPQCAQGDEACRQGVDLAGMTGMWALAVHLQCLGSPGPDLPKTLGLLPQLQSIWIDQSPGHPLGEVVQAVSPDLSACTAVGGMMRAWGR